ncbi:MAG: alpha/beta hydrolase [Gammaproteobacteria bacterium]
MGYFAAILVGAYLLLLVLVYFSQSALLYFPTHDVFATPDRAGLRYEPVQFKTADNILLDGWYLPVDPTRETLLFFHGNAGNITHRLDSLLIFAEMGLNVFIFDYRGYGQSRGSPSEHGTHLDAQAALDYLTLNRGIPLSRVIYFGRSLGGAVAARLATERAPKLLIIESTFTSVPELAAEIYPFLPARWISRFHYNTRSYLESVDIPTLIIHSRDDEIIAVHHGRALYKALPGRAEFLEIRGDHNSGFLSDRAFYVQGLKRFLEKYG